MDAAVLARQTPGFSGAELSNLVNEAALLAGKTSKPKITAEMLDSARDKALMGVERRFGFQPLPIMCCFTSVLLRLRRSVTLGPRG